MYYLVFIPDDSKPPEIKAFDDLPAAVKGLRTADYVFHHEAQRRQLLQAETNPSELVCFFANNGQNASTKGFISSSKAIELLKYENTRINAEMPYLTDDLEDARRMKQKYS